MKETLLIDNWKFCAIPNEKVIRGGLNFQNVETLCQAGFDIYNASVPGNFELDLMREGIIEDLYQGDNVIKAQKLENLHLYYFTTCTYHRKKGYDAKLAFNGIDTVAEIYVDGEYFAFTENMLHEHIFDINDWCEGEHEILVLIHLCPPKTSIYAKNYV